MDVSSSPVTEPSARLCSVVARQKHEQPIGTATPFDHFIAVEVAAPWPRKVWQAKAVPPGLVDLLADAEARGLAVRAQAILPDEQTAQTRHRRVLYFRRPAEQFAAYESLAFILPPNQVTSLIEALLDNSGDASHFDRYRQERPERRDMFICTHGSRDACCGKFGYTFYAALSRQAPAATRLWRTSHLGGHRFAPTLLDLPTGHYWGHLDPSHLPLLLKRQGPLDWLSATYRGWAGLGRFEQIAEQAVWQREGWAWLDYRKAGYILRRDEAADTSHVRLDFTRPDGTAGAYEVTVKPRGSVLTLKSSGDPELTRLPQYQVSHIRPIV